MYTQALGSVLGIMVCLYEYVYGDLTLIGNKFTEDTSYISFFCGYTLYPLCIIVFLISLFIMLLNKEKSSFNKLKKTNKYLSHIAVIIGFLGCKYLFIVPAILILYCYYIPVLFEDDLKNKKNKLKREGEVVELLKSNLGNHTIVKLLGVSYEEVEILKLLYIDKR